MSPKGRRKVKTPDPSHFPHPNHFGYELITPNDWVPKFFKEHWGKGGSVPTKTIKLKQTRYEVVDQAALPLAAQHPIMVKEEYPVILKKLEDQLDWKAPEAKEIKLDEDGRELYDESDLGPLQTPKIRRGLCIFGHTGSGKSTSLTYLLIAMLRRKQSVLGRVCINYVADLRTHGEPLVILYDAMAKDIPIDFYGDEIANFFVVLATSPQIKRFGHWFKNGVTCLTMEPFTKDEVTCLLALSPAFKKLDGFHSALDMYDYLGPSLKVLKAREVKYLADSSDENDFAAATVKQFDAIFNAPTDLWSETAANGACNWITLGTDRKPPDYHRFFVVRPVKDAERWTPEPSYTIDLITDFMGLVFISAVQKKFKVEHMAFAIHFMASPSIRGLIFEMSSIRFLSYAASSSTIFMVPNTDNLEVPSFLTTHETLLDFGEGADPPEPQELHISPIGAATIDALYEMEDGTKLLFQMTIAKKHGIADVGLKKILECYRKEDSEIGLDQFVFVFVVPDEESKDRFLTTWAEGKEVKITGEDPQTLRVGVMIINDLQVKPLEDTIRHHIHTGLRRYIDKDGKVVDLPPVLPSTLRPIKPASVPTSPSQLMSITNNYNHFIVKSSTTSSKKSPPRTRATAPLKRGNATREGAEDAPGPSKRARLDADEVPAETPAPAAVPVMEDEGRGKGKARQVDE